MQETLLAYVAGIVDGEGCIRTNLNIKKQPVVRVHVTNTNKLLVDTLKFYFGGYIWAENESYIENAKPRYIWEISSFAAENFLKLIRPYLLLKAKQADLALELRKTMGKRGYNEVSVETMNLRLELAKQIKSLNKKGLH